MSDELTPQAGGEQADEQASSAKEESELKRARDDAARYRKQFSELNAKWKEAEPVLAKFKELEESQKTETQKLADRAKAAEDAIAKHQADAERAQRELQVTRLATKAGVNLDLVAYLDLSKLDLADEKAAMEVLGMLAKTQAQAAGASNPSRGGVTTPTDEDLRKEIFGGRRSAGLFQRGG